MKPTLGHFLVRQYATYVMASHLAAFCARDSHEIPIYSVPVTLVDLKSPGIGQNAPHTVDDFEYHLGLSLFREMWFVDCSCVSSKIII